MYRLKDGGEDGRDGVREGKGMNVTLHSTSLGQPSSAHGVQGPLSPTNGILGNLLSVNLVLDSVGSISHSDTITKLGSKSLFLLVLLRRRGFCSTQSNAIYRYIESPLAEKDETCRESEERERDTTIYKDPRDQKLSSERQW